MAAVRRTNDVSAAFDIRPSTCMLSATARQTSTAWTCP